MSPEMSNHLITLYVDTKKLNSKNVDQSCHFEATAVISAADASPEDFTSEAFLGDSVTWQGKATDNPEHMVNIISVNYQGGTNAFGVNILHGNGQSPEMVFGITTQKTAEESPCKYMVQFTVSNKPGTFIIDPFLKVK